MPPCLSKTVNGVLSGIGADEHSPHIILNNPLIEQNIGPAVEWYEDKTKTLAIDDIISKTYSSRFIKPENPVPSFGFTLSAHWIRFTIDNQAKNIVEYYLMIDTPHLDDLRMYMPDPKGGFQEKRLGDIYPYHQREFEHTNFVFPLKQNPGKITYYLRIQTDSAMFVPLHLYSLEGIYRKTEITNGLNGLYYGMLLIMLIYNIFIFISVRGLDYFYYVLYLAGFIMTSLAFDGYGFHYLWPHCTTLCISSYYIFLENCLCLLFTREFLSTKANAPLLDKIVIAQIVIGFVCFGINIFKGNNFFLIIVSLIFTFISILIIFFMISITLRRGIRSAKIYLFSWSIMLVGVIIYGLMAMAVVPVNILPSSIFKFSASMQILLFSFGLADKINTMKKGLEVLNSDLGEEVKEHISDKLALKTSEERFRGVVERNFDVIFTTDEHGVLTYISPSITVLTGYTPYELIGNRFIDYLPNTRDKELAHAAFNEILKGKELIGHDTGISRKDGAIRFIELNLSPIQKNEIVIGIQGIARDTTERKIAEDALLQEKERLSITLRSIAEGVITTDIYMKIHLINKAAEDLIEYRQDEVLGRLLAEVLVLKDQKTGEYKDIFNSGIVSAHHEGLLSNTILVRRDGSEKIVSERVAPIRDRFSKIIGYVFVVRDITEEVKFHTELLKIEKLESIGILAGGIAHDFNNILTAIIGNINLAKLISKDNDRVKEILNDAEKASARAQELTQQFLTFSKGGAPVRQIASIEDIIRDSSRFILRGSNVKCTFYFQEGLRRVNIDVGQFSQVIQNLVINADQAMPDGGDIDIITENVFVTSDSGIPVQPGHYVKITVKDTGIGITPEHLPKIFDPYFTTKDNGNGLGLTSTYSIIKRHDGYILVESTVGVGTSFFIYLHSSEEGQEVILAEGEYQEHGIESGRILFMDDDEGVNATAKKMLEHMGFNVDIVSDGTAAVVKYQQSMGTGYEYDLVILDLTVPGGMGGKKTIEKLVEIDSNVKAIVSSGYSNDQIMANFVEFGFKGVIAKPYRIEDLARVIKKVMDNV